MFEQDVKRRETKEHLRVEGTYEWSWGELETKKKWGWGREEEERLSLRGQTL